MAQPVSLTTFPQEILRIILAHSHDLDSLLCTLASCRAFHSAFHSFPSPLVASLVDREIGATVLPHAIQTCRARSVHPRAHLPDTDLLAAVDDVIRHGDHTTPSSFRWTLADGIAAIRLHRIVKTLAGTFAKACVDNMEAFISNQPETTMSEVEVARIQCALYRFEMFRYLFPPPGAILGTIFKPAQFCFFSQFTPWENEQLASVHESLWRIVAPAFNLISLHDISWGEFSIDYVEEPDDLFTEQVMSRGLKTILDISNAKTYDQCYALLGCNVPVAAREFLCEALRSYGFHLVKTFAPENDAMRRVLEPDSTSQTNTDKGPEIVWPWCHRVKGLDGLVMEDEFRPMRASGYVFWEEGRLRRTGWLGQDWRDINIDMIEDVVRISPDYGEQSKSWQERSALYTKGIRGYWERDFGTDMTS